MDDSLRSQVWQRAGNRCEYCRLPQSLDVLPFQIDHIIAVKHHGLTVLENLALCCYNCNIFKGPNIAGYDLETRQVTRLFHPREDDWKSHFAWQDGILVAKAAVGRVTIDVLQINSPERVSLRQLLSQAGLLDLAG